MVRSTLWQRTRHRNEYPKCFIAYNYSELSVWYANCCWLASLTQLQTAFVFVCFVHTIYTLLSICICIHSLLYVTPWVSHVEIATIRMQLKPLRFETAVNKGCLLVYVRALVLFLYSALSSLLFIFFVFVL